jgi:hypothetical protein
MMALGDILYGIDPNTMLLITFFIIVFSILMFSLGRTIFKENNAIKTIISLAVSFFAMYGLNKSNLDLTFQFYNLGLSEEVLYIGVPILVLIFLFFLSRKKDPSTQKKRFSFGRFLMILGALMFVLGFMPFIYTKWVMLSIGAGLIALGGIITAKKKIKWNSGNSGNSNRKYRKEKERQQRHEQKLAEKQSRWQRRQQEKEIRRRAGKINKIKDRRERLQSGKGKEDKIWAQQQIDAANQQRAQQLREQKNYEKQQREIKEKQERDLRKKSLEEQKWAEEQRKRSERQRVQQIKEQEKYEEKDRGRMAQEKQKQIQIEEEKMIRMKKRREQTIKQLQSIYNQKYQEAIKQQSLAAKRVSGAREKYIQLQKELQRIVNKINKI